jgi:hypothetical protein
MKVDNTLVEVKPGFRFALTTLKMLLPDVETALFFGKTYKLDAAQLGNLLWQVHGHHDVLQALTRESDYHSHELQDYLVEIGYQYQIESGEVVLGEAEPKGEILPELWKSFEIDIAASIQEVAEKVKNVVHSMPGKEGQMLFKSMMVLNSKRPIIGDHKAYVHHAPKPDNLIIFDVSGSMSETTVQTLVDDVVALSFMANAWLVIVSNTATVWEPGSYTTTAVLEAAEYQGTHYETLAPLLNRDWGVVVTIADYDSSWSAREEIKKECTGKIELLLDISLVSRPTFLSEVVGQLATEVRPLLVAADDRCCMK